MSKPRVAVITMHRVHNFGSALQTVATERVLRRNGADAFIVDYWRPTELDDLDSLLENNFAAWGKRRSTRALFTALRWPGLNRRAQRFRSFLESSATLTPRRYLSFDELRADPPAADLYCVGSDQVWNDDYHVDGSDPYFLAWAPDDAPRFTFSASFGKTDLTPVESALVREQLPRFSAISVREASGVPLLAGYGIDATHIVDPTLGLEASEWRELAELPAGVPNEFILQYQLHRTHDLAPVVERVRSSTGLPVVTIRGFWDPRHPRGFNLSNLTVPQFLGLLANARHTVTDSFHGTAFSLNFGVPVNPVYPPNYGERIKSILELTGAGARAVTNTAQLHGVDFGPLDTATVQARLAEARAEMDRFLHGVLATAPNSQREA